MGSRTLHGARFFTDTILRRHSPGNPDDHSTAYKPHHRDHKKYGVSLRRRSARNAYRRADIACVCRQYVAVNLGGDRLSDCFPPSCYLEPLDRNTVRLEALGK